MYICRAIAVCILTYPMVCNTQINPEVFIFIKKFFFSVFQSEELKLKNQTELPVVLQLISDWG